MQFGGSNNGKLAGDVPAFNTTATENYLEMKRNVEERMLHGMAKLHDFFEMWQGSQNLSTTQKESRTQNIINDNCRVHFSC